MNFDEGLKLFREDMSKIDSKLLQNMEFVAWLIAEYPERREYIRDCIDEIVGIDINEDKYMQQIAEHLFQDVHSIAIEEYNDPAVQEHYKEMQRYGRIADNAIEVLRETGYYEKVIPSYLLTEELIDDMEPMDMAKNKFVQYKKWSEAIKQQCTEKNFVRSETLGNGDDYAYNHYNLDNDLHVYISNTEKGESKIWVFDGESMLRYEETGRMQRSICLDEISEDDFYNLELEFNIGDVKSSDNTPGYIFYQYDSGDVMTFLPDKAGRSHSGAKIYIDFNSDLSEDIGEKIEKAINSTNDPELQTSYKKALEFYTKVQEIVKTQNRENDNRKNSKTRTDNQKIDNEDLKELERLRNKKQQLQEEQRKITEAEKLVDIIENQGPNLDE